MGGEDTSPSIDRDVQSLRVFIAKDDMEGDRGMSLFSEYTSSREKGRVEYRSKTELEGRSRGGDGC